MANHLSRPIETLFEELEQSEAEGSEPVWLGTVIVGSGYGAALAALALVERGEKDVYVLERGKEVVPGEFPQTAGAAPGQLSLTTRNGTQGMRSGLWDVRRGENMTALVGRGVGGGSLTNANVAMPPPAEFIQRWPLPPAAQRSSFSAEFREQVTAVGALLLPRAPGKFSDLPKYRSLAGVAQRLKDFEVVPAQLTISTEDGKNQAGVWQSKCVQCGNCVTGCNTGAKGSLDMTVWPLVVSAGTHIFSGATALTVEGGDDAWELEVAVTEQPARKQTLLARRVILCAGTFGSTEILKRSTIAMARHRLGQGFSGNGDMLVAGISRSDAVNAVARAPSEAVSEPGTVAGRRPSGVVQVGGADAAGSVAGVSTRPHAPAPPEAAQTAPSSPVGPTIAGIAMPTERAARKGKHPRFILEDGAIPYPLRRLFFEGVAFRDLVKRLGDGSQSPYFFSRSSGSAGDGVVATEALGLHTPVHLVIGEDPQAGSLEFVGDTLIPSYPKAPEGGGYFDAVSKVLEEADLGAAQPNKAGARGGAGGSRPIRELDALGGQRVTVHPLGGCCAATSAESGVVDGLGRVFNGNSGPGTYESLYVLDGSIVPGSLGVNPFLTIASLSYLLASKIAKRSEREPLQVQEQWQRRPAPRAVTPVRDERQEEVMASLQERLYMKLHDPERTSLRMAFPGRNWETATALVVDVDYLGKDLLRFSSAPWEELPATYHLSIARVPFGDTVPTTSLTRVASFSGSVNLGLVDVPESGFGRFFRRVGVLGTLLRNRGRDLLRSVWNRIKDRLTQWGGASSSQGRSMWSMARTLWQQSAVHAERRRMRYTFAGPPLAAVSREIPSIVEFRGEKKLEYRGDQPAPIRRLRELPFRLSLDGDSVIDSSLRVDMVRFTGESSALQVRDSPDSVTTALAQFSAVAFFGRALLSSMFWSFARPSYRRFGSKSKENLARKIEPPRTLQYRVHPGQAAAKSWRVAKRDRAVLAVLGAGEKRRPVRLVRYRPSHTDKPGKTFLLMHGLAQNSRIFYTETVKTPMVQYLLGRGCDVWLFDHSLSVGLQEEPNQQITLDDLAADDMPWAVDYVHELSMREGGGKEGAHVVAHCLAAGAFSMALLSGSVDASAKVASLTLHAMTPWLAASEDNRWRANLMNLFKDRLTGYLDVIPHDNPSTAESLYDAISGSLHWGSEMKSHCRHDRGQQFSRTICNRCALFFGPLWNHEQLSPETHRRLAELMGAGSLQMMRHAHACVTSGRLTDSAGRNSYVKREQVERRWRVPTQFIIGTENKVFTAESSRRSFRELRGILEGLHDSDVPRIDLREFSGYGHTDVLFGKNAARDVFPAIFEGPRAQAEQSQQRAPHRGSEVGPSDRIVVGPIISRPRRVDPKDPSKGIELRVWAATSELSVDQPSSLSVPGLGDKAIARKKPRLGHRTGRPAPDERHFFLGDLHFDKEHRSARVPSPVFHPMPGPPFAERLPPAISWRQLPWFRRMLSQDWDSGKVSFLLGSCLHPGLGIERKLSDQVFGKMWTHVAEETGVDHLLLLGDQIYADAFGDLLDPTSPVERYRKRYSEAFGGPFSLLGKNAHRLMSHLPTYFAVDDHEIRNDWPVAGGTPRDPEDEENALDSAYRFVGHHCLEAVAHGVFWHSFVSGGCHFFVFDTRTQRRGNDVAHPGGPLDQAQWEAFVQWLKDRRDEPQTPLFLCSGTPLVPLDKDLVDHPELSRRSDGLLRFPEFVKAVCRELAPIENPVVWLSGDLHLSSVSRVTLSAESAGVASGEESCEASLVQVVGSGLFSPFPFANTPPASFDHNNKEQVFSYRGLTVRSFQELLVGGCQSNFVRVELEGRSLKVYGFPNPTPRGGGPPPISVDVPSRAAQRPDTWPPISRSRLRPQMTSSGGEKDGQDETG